jgi:hypothetical protein
VAARAIAGLHQRLAAHDDFRRWLGCAFASRERTAQQQQKENRPAGSVSKHPTPVSMHYSGVTAFRAKPFARHKPKWLADIPGTKLRLLQARLPSRYL